jgi:hypothetical protein
MLGSLYTTRPPLSTVKVIKSDRFISIGGPCAAQWRNKGHAQFLLRSLVERDHYED